jgi:hypothetical protein
MKAELFEKYNQVFSNGGDFKYYSPKTVYNLIYHLDSLEEGNKKSQVVQALDEYLEYISENSIDNIEDSQVAFRTYLHPIIRYYVKKVGFISYAKPQIMLPIFLVPSFVVLYFFNSTITWIVVCFVLVCSFTYNYQKYKAKKTYGLAW